MLKHKLVYMYNRDYEFSQSRAMRMSAVLYNRCCFADLAKMGQPNYTNKYIHICEFMFPCICMYVFSVYHPQLIYSRNMYAIYTAAKEKNTCVFDVNVQMYMCMQL